MIKSFTDNAWEEFKYWQQEDKKIEKKIIKLLDDIDRHPSEGLGKPEHLSYLGKNIWSRRITDEHRLVYTWTEDNIIVYQCRYHYNK